MMKNKTGQFSSRLYEKKNRRDNFRRHNVNLKIAQTDANDAHRNVQIIALIQQS